MLASFINHNAASDPMSRITQLIDPTLPLTAVNHHDATTACIDLPQVLPFHLPLSTLPHAEFQQ
ncbi:hypothetical protein [Aeromonas salmonicida]|uniref:hypothetical protein n=1 Tax=Aeromonas salmonicida TaxID=645 RepID=UPI002FEE4CC3